ncbi:hypothetical protein DFH09DRAFT_1309378 [Mycena vulgaris]|nr:hypothetical protein DFH09DRAFT_1309378 [Mycena vulgaris]
MRPHIPPPLPSVARYVTACVPLPRALHVCHNARHHAAMYILAGRAVHALRAGAGNPALARLPPMPPPTPVRHSHSIFPATNLTRYLPSPTHPRPYPDPFARSNPCPPPGPVLPLECHCTISTAASPRVAFLRIVHPHILATSLHVRHRAQGFRCVPLAPVPIPRCCPSPCFGRAHHNTQRSGPTAYNPSPAAFRAQEYTLTHDRMRCILPAGLLHPLLHSTCSRVRLRTSTSARSRPSAR